MGHEAAYDEVQTAVLLQQVMQVGAGERIGQALRNYCFARQWCGFRHDLTAKTLRIEQAASNSQMMNVYHRSTGFAGGCQQAGNFRQRGGQRRQSCRRPTLGRFPC